MTRLRLVNEYGGKGPLTFPADHVPAIRVPKGGSCCANCMFVDAENHECTEPHYIAWNGSPKLPPLPLDEICSDWYDWPGSAEGHHPNAPVDCYIWTLNQRGEVVERFVSGPHTERVARARAADEARRSALDRAVSRGYPPSEAGFEIVCAYEARTGKRIV